jgi:hypothetical protein
MNIWNRLHQFRAKFRLQSLVLDQVKASVTQGPCGGRESCPDDCLGFISQAARGGLLGREIMTEQFVEYGESARFNSSFQLILDGIDLIGQILWR